MAKVSITRYSTDARRWSRLSQGQAMAMLGAHDGDRIELTLDDGDAHHSEAASTAGVYRIKVSGADVSMRIGKEAVADETGELWEDGETDCRFVASGERISCVLES